MGKQFLTPVVLPADPTQPLEAVTKQYVDARAGSEIEISTTDPIGTNPSAELWFDTDDPSGGVVNPAFDGTPQPVGVSGSPGVSTNWARGDHIHAASAYTSFNGNPSPVAVAPAPGSSTSWARGDHVHPFAPGLLGRRLNDNGQMAVKQRTAVTVAGFANATYLADRWFVGNSGVGVASLNYIAAASFAAVPAGRPRPGSIEYIVMTTAEAAGALAAADFMMWQQSFEGQFLQHLMWGSAYAQPLTYSFDIYSPIATTYVVELFRNETTARTISVLLPVPQGFSTQSVTFPGDQTTAITNDNAARLSCAVWIGAGSQWTSGILQTAWGNSVNGNRAAGISNTFAATNGNQFALTNAQLEVGTVPTPYEVRPYDDELRRCLRYFERLSAVPNYGRFGMAQATSATGAQALVYYDRKRAVPTLTFSTPLSAFILTGAGGTVISTTSLVQNTPTPTSSSVLAGVASGLVAGNATQLLCDTTTSAYIDISAEI